MSGRRVWGWSLANVIGLVVALISMWGAFALIDLADRGDLTTWIACPSSLLCIMVSLVAAQFIDE